MLTFIALILGLAAGARFSWVFYLPFDYWKGKKFMKSITPQKADKDKLCKGPHVWINANSFSAKGPGTIQVCSVCGLISGTDTVLSQEAIDKIEEKNDYLEMENKLLNEFMKREDDEIKFYFETEIKGGLDFQKLAAIHTAGMTFGERFWIYKASRSKELREENTRSNA